MNLHKKWLKHSEKSNVYSQQNREPCLKRVPFYMAPNFDAGFRSNYYLCHIFYRLVDIFENKMSFIREKVSTAV